MSRWELHSSAPDTEHDPGGLMALTDSPEQARKWVAQGGAALDTNNGTWAVPQTRGRP